jgi:hypothetical protein
LVAVLAVGNYLNLGTTNGAAVAFKLQALTKLADTKSIDGDESLMSFLATSLLDSGLRPLAQEVPACLSGWMETTLEVCLSSHLLQYTCCLLTNFALLVRLQPTSCNFKSSVCV